MAKKNAKKGSSAALTEVSNAAKSLLANIRFMRVDDPIKTIAITSSIPNEGKSYVAEQLCRAIATSGRTVLLMEGDLRRRTLGGRLGVRGRHGLYSVLSGEVKATDAIMPMRDVQNMYFLDAEPNIPNPSDLFNSKRFKRLLAALAQAYDYVVIDTPPLGAFIDSAVVSAQMDATLLVVRENFTRKEDIKASYEQLQKAGGNVTGVVMNYCEQRSSGYYGYYYYSYYYEDEESASGPAHGGAANKGGLFGRGSKGSKGSKAAKRTKSPRER